MSGRLISWVILWWNFMVESFYDFPLGLLMISIVFPSGKIRKKTSEKSMVSPCFPRNHWGKKKFTTPLKMPQLEMCSNAMLATLVWLVKPWKTSTFFINDVFFQSQTFRIWVYFMGSFDVYHMTPGSLCPCCRNRGDLCIDTWPPLRCLGFR